MPRLFSSLRLGPVEARNRVVVAAHSTNLADANRVTDGHVAYYGAKALGGAGVVVLGGLRVHPTTVGGPLSITVFDDGCVPGLARLAGAVREGGALAVGQLLHMGRQRSGGPTEWPMWAPSPLPCPVMREVPHELTVAEIGELVGCFAAATRRCVEAGLDGIELHAAHGYLPQQFLSPLTNHRTDAYGGSLEHRLRFLLELLAACRDAAGGRIAVGVRISGDELVEGGLRLPEMQEVAPRLVAAGADYLSVSHCNYTGLAYAAMIPEMTTPPGAYAHLARGIREAIGQAVPVFAVGRILRPEQAEALLADGTCDAVAIVRAAIADPEWARKAQEGRADEIRPCIGCNQGCAGMIHTGKTIRCLTNPDVGRELESVAVAPASARRVVVVGGGPAGLEAALTARLRGHKVVVLERDAEPGGAIRLGAALHGRGELAGCVDWRLGRLAALGVELRCGIEADVDAVLALAPDAVVLATGAEPAPPELAGAEQGRLLTAEEAVVSPERVGGTVVLVDDDGHYRGCGVAEHLARRRRDVRLVTRMATTGADLPAMNLGPQLARLGEAGVRVLAQRRVVRVDGSTVVVQPVAGGPEEPYVGVDTVVIAGRRVARTALAVALAALAPQLPVVLAGDCVAPRTALQAIAEGRRAGLAV